MFFVFLDYVIRVQIMASFFIPSIYIQFSSLSSFFFFHFLCACTMTIQGIAILVGASETQQFEAIMSKTIITGPNRTAIMVMWTNLEQALFPLMQEKICQTVI